MIISSRCFEKSLLQNEAEVLLGRTIRRPVIVGEIKMCNTSVKGPPNDGAARFENICAAEILPKTE